MIVSRIQFSDIPAMTRLKHYDNLGTVRFITFSCYRRLPLLIDDHIRILIIENLIKIRKKFKIKIYGYVLMPEHIHLVIFPPIDTKIGPVIGELKSNSAYYALDYLKKSGVEFLNQLKVVRDGKQKLSFWQKRCYDHNCRSIKTVKEKIIYCHKNPVTRGLVNEPSEWKWSSYNWYNGKQDVPISMDVLEV